MKTKAVTALLAFALGIGCYKLVGSTSPDDRYEVLIWHLLTENQELSSRSSEEFNTCLEQKNQLLRDQINGVRRPYTLEMQKRDTRAMMDSTVDGLKRLSEHLLDVEDAIEEFNRRHPDRPKSDVLPALRPICGQCAEERAERDKKLAAERKP